jgi:hypothetical protein
MSLSPVSEESFGNIGECFQWMYGSLFIGESFANGGENIIPEEEDSRFTGDGKISISVLDGHDGAVEFPHPVDMSVTDEFSECEIDLVKGGFEAFLDGPSGINEIFFFCGRRQAVHDIA